MLFQQALQLSEALDAFKTVVVRTRSAASLVVSARCKDDAANSATEMADNIATQYSLALMPSRHRSDKNVIEPATRSLGIKFGDVLHRVNYLKHMRCWCSKRHQAQLLLDRDVCREFYGM